MLKTLGSEDYADALNVLKDSENQSEFLKIMREIERLGKEGLIRHGWQHHKLVVAAVHYSTVGCKKACEKSIEEKPEKSKKKVVKTKKVAKLSREDLLS